MQHAAGRFVGIVGPSGSGKPSLLRAGLLPRLQRLSERWVVVPAFWPGQHPIRNLASSLARAFAARGRSVSAGEVAARLERGPGELGVLDDAVVVELLSRGRLAEAIQPIAPVSLSDLEVEEGRWLGSRCAPPLTTP